MILAAKLAFIQSWSSATPIQNFAFRAYLSFHTLYVTTEAIVSRKVICTKLRCGQSSLNIAIGMQHLVHQYRGFQESQDDWYLSVSTVAYRTRTCVTWVTK